jgi:cell division protein FtsA
MVVQWKALRKSCFANFLASPMPRAIVTGLDIGTATIRVAVCEYKTGSNVPHVLALVKKSSRGLRRGYVVNFDEAYESISEALQEAEHIAHLKIKKVIVGIGGVTLESRTADGSIAISRADGEVTEVDLNRAMEASESSLADVANKHIIHRFPLYFKLDGKRVLGRPEGMKGNKLEVRNLFITSASQHLKDMVKAVEETGVDVEDIIASPLAASFVTMSRLQKTAGCVLANIGSQTTSIIIFEENIPISLHVFPIGSMDITNDIALGLKIPLEEAERVKRGEGEMIGTRRKLDEIIEARLSDIFELIEMHLKKIGRSQLLPAGIIITGGGSAVTNISDIAKNYFKLPATIAAPTVISKSKNQSVDSSWSVAYGLCLFGSDVEPEESIGVKITRKTKANFVKWLKELLP